MFGKLIFLSKWGECKISLEWLVQRL